MTYPELVSKPPRRKMRPEFLNFRPDHFQFQKESRLLLTELLPHHSNLLEISRDRVDFWWFRRLSWNRRKKEVLVEHWSERMVPKDLGQQEEIIDTYASQRLEKSHEGTFIF